VIFSKHNIIEANTNKPSDCRQMLRHDASQGRIKIFKQVKNSGIISKAEGKYYLGGH